MTLSAAWADGIYLTAWPRFAVALSIVAVVIGFTVGAGHWSPYAIGDNSTATTGRIIVFAESLPFLFIATVLGTLGAHFGVMLVFGYVVGDYLIAGPAVAAWGYNSAWPVFFGERLPLLLCYWLLFMLAARTTLTSNSLAASLLRSLRGNDATSRAIRVATTAAFQFALVYVWTLATPMIIRVLWIWTGRGNSPITVPYYQSVVDPWLPLAAAAAVVVRGFLMQRALSREVVSRRARTLMSLSRRADAAPALSRRMPLWVRAIIAAAATTFLFSGLLLSFAYAAAMFVLFAGVMLARVLVLPKTLLWAAWARAAARVPLAARLSAAAVLVFLISRFIIAIPGALNGQGKFGIELVCLAIGFPLMLLAAANGEGGSAPSFIAAGQQGSGVGTTPRSFGKIAGTAVLLICVLYAGNTYASCADDSCCLVTFAIAGLLVGALLILGIEFVLPMMGIDLLAMIAEAFPGIAEFFGEDAAEAILDQEAEDAIAEEEAAATERLQDIADKANPDLGRRNCAWVAREVDQGFADMFAGRTPDPYAPGWYTSSDFAPDAFIRGADVNTQFFPGDAPAFSYSSPQVLEDDFGGSFTRTSMQQIADQIQAAGNGSRGLVAVTNGTTGHVFNVVNYGGRVFFVDGQTAFVTSDVSEIVSSLAGRGYASAATWFLPTM